jgi:hypothetical protein
VGNAVGCVYSGDGFCERAEGGDFDTGEDSTGYISCYLRRT